MAFQDRLFQVPTIRIAWRAGHRQEIIREDVSFLEICEDLNKCVEKISLKTSAVLIAGAARTCSAELDELYNDVIKLDKDLKTRNKKIPIEEDEESESFETSSLTLPASTLNSTSSTQSASTSSPKSSSQPGTTLQPKSTTTSQSGSTSTSQFGSKTTSQSGSKSTSNLESTSQRESARSTSLPQLEDASLSRSTPQSRSTSQLRSTSQSVSTSSKETRSSESSSDHEDYFPLTLDSPEQIGLTEWSSDHEDFSPTYTTNETKRRNYLINPVRNTLSTITEEDSSIYRRGGRTTLEKSAVIDRSVLSISSNSIRFRSDIRESEQTPKSQFISRKRKKPDSSDDVSETETLERSRISDVGKEKEKKYKSDLNKAFIRTTEGSVEESETDETERTSSEISFVLQSANIQKHKDIERKKRRQQVSETLCNIIEPDIIEPQQRNFLYPGTSPETRLMRHQDAQVSPLQSNISEFGNFLLTARTSTDGRNVRDQETQITPNHANELELEEPAIYDRGLPFSSVSLYGPCQCDQRVPCGIIYSSVDYIS